MTEHNWADNEVLRATDVTNVLEEQVVFTQATMGTPWLGKHVYRSDRDILYRFDGANWLSYPMGCVQKDTISATGVAIIGSTQTAINTSQLAWPLIATERYMYQLDLKIIGDINSSGEYCTVNFQVDGTDVDTDAKVYIPVGLVDFRHSFQHVYSVGSNGSHTFQATIKHNGSTGKCGVLGGTDVSLIHIGGPQS